MTSTKRNLITLLLFTFTWGYAVKADAQFSDNCSPYNYDNCTPIIDQHRFMNVPVNAPGLEWAFISIQNVSAYPAKVRIKVTKPGRPVQRFEKEFDLLPGELLEPELISLWPELAGYQGGVSVVVGGAQTVSASVAVHPKIDPNAPDLLGQLILYWRFSRVWEGR